MKRNNLFEELNIEESENTSYTALDIDVQSIKCKVNTKIASASKERKLNVMKSKKKLALIAAAAVLALGVTAFAATGIVKMQFASTSSIPDYTLLPTQEQVVKDIGYKAVLIDTFANGYKFKDGSVVKNNFTDENRNSVEKFKSVSFNYEKDGDMVYFSQGKHNSETEKQGEVIATESGASIYYYSYINKFVPTDYEFTEEDKKAEESGEIVFSIGASEVETQKVQSVIWEKDGVEYCLLQIGGKLTTGELADMAKEVINK